MSASSGVSGVELGGHNPFATNKILGSDVNDPAGGDLWEMAGS